MGFLNCRVFIVTEHTHTIKCTPTGRAMLNFQAQVSNNPEYYTSESYLIGLVSTHEDVNKKYGQICVLLFVLSTASYMTMDGSINDVVFFNIQLFRIPGFAESICFMLGAVILLFCTSSIDLYIQSRVRYEIVHVKYFTDIPNITISDKIKSGFWSDLLSADIIGYKTGKSLEYFSLFAVVALLLLPFSLLLISLISIAKLFYFCQMVNDSWSFGGFVISVTGIILAVTGLALIFTLTMCRFKYSVTVPDDGSSDSQ